MLNHNEMDHQKYDWVDHKGGKPVMYRQWDNFDGEQYWTLPNGLVLTKRFMVCRAWTAFGNSHVTLLRADFAYLMMEGLWEKGETAIPKGMMLIHKNRSLRDDRIANLKLVPCNEISVSWEETQCWKEEAATDEWNYY